MINTKIKKAGIGFFSLIMLITGPIDSIRNLPSAALFGASLIFFVIFSAVLFLVPASLAAAELSSHPAERGGIYEWVKSAFGEKIAFLAIWLQWINTMVWFPSILSFIAGTFAYLIDPSLVQNKFYLFSVIIVVFWGLTFINLKGLAVSAKFINISSLLGVLLPMLTIIAFAIYWICSGKNLQIHFTTTNWLPSFDHLDNWVSLTAIMAGFLGMELACVHLKDVSKPKSLFSAALFVSVLIILFTMIMGSLAIAVVLPVDKINLVNGVMVAFTQFFVAYHMSWIIPVMTVLILLGSLGNMVSWIISPAKGLLAAAESNYLPQIFKKKNKHGVASHLLITQAILVTVICVVVLLISSVNSFYWLLTALSTQLYMLMYIIMFAALIKLKYQLRASQPNYVIPFGKFGIWMAAIFGVSGCVITLIVGFIPPAEIHVASYFNYEMACVIGMGVMLIPALLLLALKAGNKMKTHSTLAAMA
ncbi:MAG: APC family permease [Gammaproteobacteria bacterium]|nr:APC family permease [Gammaproteobacteria bacterium]